MKMMKNVLKSRMFKQVKKKKLDDADGGGDETAKKTVMNLGSVHVVLYSLFSTIYLRCKPYRIL